MNGTATDIIVARSRNVDRLSTTIVWSVAAHVAVTAIVMLAPHPTPDTAPKQVMMISLGGAPGPRTGMTQMATSPAVDTPKPEAAKPVERPPAPKAPAMTLPDPKAKPQARRETAREAAAKAAPTEPEPQPRTTRVRGQGFEGFGLSSGGGGGGGVTVDAVDFCCPDYINTMVELVRLNWNGRQGRVGVTTMKFTIRRNGRIEGIQLEKPSGFDALDKEAERALRVARVPELPGRYPNETLTVHLEFEYLRR